MKTISPSRRTVRALVHLHRPLPYHTIPLRKEDDAQHSPNQTAQSIMLASVAVSIMLASVAVSE